MQGSILSRINAVINELPVSEKTIGLYILKNPIDIVKMTVHELAEKSGGSSSAVVRFCRSIGLQGFPDLKIKLAGELVAPKEIKNYDIERNETVSSVIEKRVSHTVQTLYDTASQLNEEEISTCVDLLKKASVIYVYGIGASALVAEDFAQKWIRLGKHVFTHSDNHVMGMALTTAPKDSVFIGISYSGETPEVLAMMSLVQKMGIRTIGLSRYSHNKLVQMADHMLYTAIAPEAQLRTAATSSRIAQLLVVDILFFIYATSQYDTSIQQLTKTKKMIDQLKE